VTVIVVLKSAVGNCPPAPKARNSLWTTTACCMRRERPYPGLLSQRQRAALRAASCRWITACTCVGRGRSVPRSSPHKLSGSASRVSRKCRASHAWWLSRRSATARPTTAAASRAQGSWPPGRHDAAPKVTGLARTYCWSTAAPRDACPRPSTPDAGRRWRLSRSL